MNPASIALISGQSLLVEGVASRLKSHLDKMVPKLLSPHEDDVLSRLILLQPAAIIFDSRDPGARKVCALPDLLHLLPETKVMILDSQQSELQIISSQREAIADAQALLEQVLAII